MPKDLPLRRHPWLLPIGAVALLVIAGCTSTTDSQPTGSASRTSTPGSSSPADTSGPGSASAAPASSTTASASETTPSPEPEPQAGLLTGPGVTEKTITLGVLSETATDRGFGEGLALWQTSANAAGGICGRSVELRSAGKDGVPGDPVAAYNAVGTEVLGFATLAGTRTDAVSTLLSTDNIPALTPQGLSSALAARSPVILGPTDDVVGLDAASYLVKAGLAPAGSTVGVISDGSATAVDAVQGATWAAERAGLTLDVIASTATVPASWSNYPVVLVFGGPTDTAAAAEAVTEPTVIMTTGSGYDPVVNADAAARILVTTPTPVLDSDHPGATVVVAAATEAGITEPGPLLFQGFATGTGWQRLLTAACDAGSLTRDGVLAAVTTVGPAPIDSLLGASDPALPGSTGRAASLSAMVSQGDPAVPGGLRPLTGLELAEGIDEYIPGG